MCSNQLVESTEFTHHPKVQYRSSSSRAMTTPDANADPRNAALHHTEKSFLSLRKSLRKKMNPFKSNQHP